VISAVSAHCSESGTMSAPCSARRLAGFFAGNRKTPVASQASFSVAAGTAGALLLYSLDSWLILPLRWVFLSLKANWTSIVEPGGPANCHAAAGMLAVARLRSVCPRCRVTSRLVSGYFSSDSYAIRFGRYLAFKGFGYRATYGLCAGRIGREQADCRSPESRGTSPGRPNYSNVDIMLIRPQKRRKP
jgi:hypothetical protein